MATGAVSAVALGGCGGARHAAHAQKLHRPLAVQLAARQRLSRHAPASLARRELPPAGATQGVDVRGSHLAVTLRRVIDPLVGSGARLPRGTHAVGVVVQIRNHGPSVYDSSATGDIRLLASRGVVSPVLATHGSCRTPLQDFDSYITSGEDRVGCVAFAVADGATLDAVRFYPRAHRRGRLSWAP